MPGERLSAQERKAQILRCATRVFARSNYRVAGMAEIAREAGISEPTVYKHYTSKKALFLTILERVGESTLRHWREIAERTPDRAVLLRQIGFHQYDVVAAHPDTLKVQFQALSEVEDPDIRETLHRNFAAYATFFAEILRAGQEEGVFRSDLDVPTAAWQLISIGFTLNLTSLLGFDDVFGRETLAVMGDHLVLTYGADAPRTQGAPGPRLRS